MLESSVSVLPSDWCSLSGWPEFQQTYCNFVCVCLGGGAGGGGGRGGGVGTLLFTSRSVISPSVRTLNK